MATMERFFFTRSIIFLDIVNVSVKKGIVALKDEEDNLYTISSDSIQYSRRQRQEVSHFANGHDLAVEFRGFWRFKLIKNLKTGEVY